MSPDRPDRFADENKHKSRRVIWHEFSYFKHPGQANVLILPGTQRFEFEVVLEFGFKPEHVYMVEKNPAVMAILTRRSKGKPYPPRENRMVKWLSQAGWELKRRKVTIDVAHLDFCSNCEGEKQMISEIREFFNADILAPESLVAITWLKGREHEVEDIGTSGMTFGVIDGASAEFDRLDAYDKGRLRKVYEAVGGVDISVVKMGHYQNVTSRQPMLWIILRVKKNAQAAQAASLIREASPKLRSGTRQWLDRS